MDVLITGCERSGTTCVIDHIRDSYPDIATFNEPKWTTACYKMYQELYRWRLFRPEAHKAVDHMKIYIQQQQNSQGRMVVEKHSMNNEQCGEFLQFLIDMHGRNTRTLYIVRDGRDVVESIVNKKWGYSEFREYRKHYGEAINQWNKVINDTFEQAVSDPMTTVLRYEDLPNFDFDEYLGYTGRVPFEFKEKTYPRHNGVEERLMENLIKTGYSNQIAI